jgi:hypothetical protein
MDFVALREYEAYVAASEPAMAARFEAGDLSWLPDFARTAAFTQLAAGKLIRWNISDSVVNQRLAGQNGTIIDWVGAIRIRRTKLAELRAVLEDYNHYAEVYRPMIFECRAAQITASTYDATIGLNNKFRFASVFPQHYSFQVRARISYSSGDPNRVPDSELLIHLRSDEIRESDSGVPGRMDLLEPYHDHGIMWALNSWWRARQQGPDLYLEFESVTLARSAQQFACRLGIIPVPRSIVSSAMDSIPAESLETVLAGTRAECARRASQRVARASPE